MTTTTPSLSTATSTQTTALNHTALSITLTPHPSVPTKPHPTPSVLTILLDRSYSMNGPPLENAKTAIAHFLPHALQTFATTLLVPFDDTTLVHDLTSLTAPDAAALVAAVPIGSGTCFATAFATIADIVVARPGLQHTVVFLTDGEDYGELRSEEQKLVAVENLSQVLKVAPSSEVHCIGFREHHDAKLLTLLTSAGTAQGTFVYVAEEEEIESAVDVVFAMSTIKRLRGFVTVSGPGAAESENFHDVTFDYDGTSAYTAFLLLQNKTAESLQIVVNDQTLTCPVTSPVTDEWDHLGEGMTLPNDAFLRYAEAVHNTISARVCADISALPAKLSDKSYLMLLRDEYTAFSSEIHNDILPRAHRNKLAKTLLLESLSIIKQFYTEVLVDAIRGNVIENVKFAQLANVAFRGVRKRRIQSVLSKRAIRNVSQVDRLEERVEKKLRTIDFDSEQFADVGDYGRCIFSFLDYKQAMEGGDCLCLGLEIQRPEAAIVDPSRLIVKNVATSLITSDAFLTAVQYQLNPGADQPDGISVHGGFQPGVSGTVLTGQSREIINGALPLFINEQHWSIAKLRIGPLFGWMATLDVLGYSYEQVVTIPFLVLEKLRNNLDQSEYGQRMLGWVMQTCTHIFEESRVYLHGNLFETGVDGEQCLRYLEDPVARLPDVIPSHDIFVSYLFVAGALKNDSFHLIPDQKKRLVQYITIEEFRRRQQSSNVVLTRALRDTKIAEAVGSLSDEHWHPFMTIIEKELGDNGLNVKFDDLLEKLNLPMWRESLIEMDSSKSQRQFLVSLLARFNKSLGIDTIFSKAQEASINALVLTYPTSSSIRESTTYTADLEEALREPVAFLSKRFDVTIRANLRSRFQLTKKKMEWSLEANAIRAFLEVRDLAEAAELLRGRLYVGRNLGYYVSALCGRDIALGVTVGGEVVHGLEKIGMLVSGLYNGKELYLDSDNEKRREAFSGLAWKPRRRIVRRFFKRFAIDATDEEVLKTDGVSSQVVDVWKTMFQWQKRELELWSVESTATGEPHRVKRMSDVDDEDLF